MPFNDADDRYHLIRTRRGGLAEDSRILEPSVNSNPETSSMFEKSQVLIQCWNSDSE